MGKKSKSKGKRGEREVAAFLRRYGYKAERGWADSLDCVTDFPAHCEVKRTERLLLWSALEQSQRDAGADPATVWHRTNKRDWVIILTAKDLMRLIGAKEQEEESDATVRDE